jgi:hypothetical protein
MTSKIKTATTLSERAAKLAATAGMLLMSIAALSGVFDYQDQSHGRIVLPSRPTFAFALENDQGSNPLRREREEIGPHFISYSETQRTPSRTGKQ